MRSEALERKKTHLGCRYEQREYERGPHIRGAREQVGLAALRPLVQREAKKRARPYVKLTEEKKVALTLAALEVPKSKGVYWDRRRSCWTVSLATHGKNWHLGRFDFDDHTKAVAAYSRHKSMTKTELEALDKRR